MIIQARTLPEYLESLQSQGRYWFLKAEAIETLKLSSSSFINASNRLVAKGKLTRVHSDFYVIVPPEHRAFASLPASWFIHHLMAKIDQPYYVGLLTAAGLHGAAHQQAMAFQIITTKAMRRIVAGRVRIQFYNKKSIEPDYYQDIKTASGIMHVSTPEMTAFDLVRYSHAAGEMQHVATVLSELAEKIDPEVLLSYLKKGAVEAATAQRLFYLLETLKPTMDLGPLEAELKLRKPVKRLLVQGGSSSTIGYNQRWKIIINELLEPDDL